MKYRKLLYNIAIQGIPFSSIIEGVLRCKTWLSTLIINNTIQEEKCSPKVPINSKNNSKQNNNRDNNKKNNNITHKKKLKIIINYDICISSFSLQKLFAKFRDKHNK